MTEPRSGRPNDFSVRYEWVAGSMPPPYHYEYMITIGPGTGGEVVLRPDYSGMDAPEWSESFSVSEEALDGLWDLLGEHDVFGREWTKINDGVVGGSLQWMRGAAGGKEFSIPSRVAESVVAMYAAVKSIVPEAVMSDLLSRREEYERSYVEPQ